MVLQFLSVRSLGFGSHQGRMLKRKCHLEAEITTDVQTAFLTKWRFVGVKEGMRLCRHISL